MGPRMIDCDDVRAALRSAVLGERESNLDQASTFDPGRHDRRIDREIASFALKLQRFLGDMPEDWTINELIDIVGEVEDEASC